MKEAEPKESRFKDKPVLELSDEEIESMSKPELKEHFEKLLAELNLLQVKASDFNAKKWIP